MPTLTTMKEHSAIENSKQTFAVLNTNMNKVLLGNAPSQGVEIKMYRSTLSVTTNNSIMIYLYNNTGVAGVPEAIFDGQTGNIEYKISDVLIAYEGTGVWAKYPHAGTVMVDKPYITNSSRGLVIPLGHITVVGTNSIGGSGLSRIVADGSTPLVFEYSNIKKVNVTIVSDYWQGWRVYMESFLPFKYVSQNDRTLNISYDAYDATSGPVDVKIVYTPLEVRLI
ncbi:MAG TPA: hypothetical protein HA257_01235 [Candidatus Methanoperedenaceae archaeon]|nr:hypothetical protein [Candidatus Methanoperedenaceae archaeon]